ncbi:uncharacterized protein LOC112604166 [Melanaphis sacchari]|uniref:uncharacterized protein LOC112604166 n=1 Tax=Melanaphis sacchari TaxID=742174 RepID=UPI000DC15256|nr:uncharacterized protein LOC112604166 [Melanaphis sacchari]
MATKLLWITIIHVLLWNLIFSVTESIELDGFKDLSSNNFRDRVRFTTHICDRLKDSPPPVAYHNNDESLSDSDSDAGLVKDMSKAVNPVKRHASLRCYIHNTQENKEPNNLDPSITSEWQMKSTPANNGFGADLYDHSIVQKPKVVNLKDVDINAHQGLLYSKKPFLQKGNLIGEIPNHKQLQLNLQDKTNKIKSLMSAPQHKFVNIIPDKLLDESLHTKLVQPSLTFPLPAKFIKSPLTDSLLRPIDTHNSNGDSAVLTVDNDKKKDPLILTPPSLHNIPNKNVYQKDSTVEKKPLLMSFPSIQINKPKPVEISDDKHIPPIAYRPSPPSPVPQYIKAPVTKPIFVPIFVNKGVITSPEKERPQANIGSLLHSKIIKNGITEPTSQPILIEKKVTIALPQKKQPGLIDLLSPTQFIKTPETDIVHKPIKIEKDASISEQNGQKQQIIDYLSPQTPQFIKTPDKESSYQGTSEQTIVSVNAPYEQKQSIINLPSPPQITGNFNSESASQIMPIQKEVSTFATYIQQQPLVEFSPPPEFQKIKIQKEVSISLPNQEKKIVDSPPNLINSFNTEFMSQSISQKKNSLYDQQKPIILPSPPPLIKTTTSAYVK